jgi:hypothetical protein
MRPLPCRYEAFSPNRVCCSSLRAPRYILFGRSWGALCRHHRLFRCGSGDSPRVELPESTWSCKHPRDLSTHP